MPNKLPPVHSQFKPGQSGNPKGRKPNLLSKERVRSVMAKLSELTKKELYDMTMDGSTPVLEAMIAAIMHKSIKNGDASNAEFLFQRAYGKVKDEIEVSTPPELEALKKLSLDELMIYVQTNIQKVIE